MSIIKHIQDRISTLQDVQIYGTVTSIIATKIIAKGLEKMLPIGAICEIFCDNGAIKMAEVIGATDSYSILMLYEDAVGIKPGDKVKLCTSIEYIYPCDAWIGRVINAFGEPIDGKGPIPSGDIMYNIRGSSINAYSRKRVGAKIKMGIRAVDIFVPCCIGQRLGIFAGSGVGKSVLISMCVKHADADVKIISLVGERGREVQEFIQDYLGEGGMERAIVIVATSDEPALKRRRAALLGITISEYFRDANKHVMFIMDNVTRLAMAQREIGLAAGEMPVMRGYTPSVFTELPKLLERSGPGYSNTGDITALFAVLVEGDDNNEPISDTVRGILDGHIVLDRKIAQIRYPAVNILQSISRMLPMCNTNEENEILQKAKMYLSLYEDMEDMIKLGIYKQGTDEEVDRAIVIYRAMNAFLSQQPDINSKNENTLQMLQDIIFP